MNVQSNIDRASFAAVLGPANSEFEKRFGRALIEQIKAAA